MATVKVPNDPLSVAEVAEVSSLVGRLSRDPDFRRLARLTNARKNTERPYEELRSAILSRFSQALDMIKE